MVPAYYDYVELVVEARSLLAKIESFQRQLPPPKAELRTELLLTGLYLARSANSLEHAAEEVSRENGRG